MRAVRVLVSRLWDILVGGHRDRRVREELQHHLDLLAAEHTVRGLSPADAALAARRSFGGVDQVLAGYRDQRGWPWLQALVCDASFACRQLARDLRFTLTTLLVLALGIGISHLFFTLTYAHTMRGLPIDDPGRVLFISTVSAKGGDRGLCTRMSSTFGPSSRCSRTWPRSRTCRWSCPTTTGRPSGSTAPSPRRADSCCLVSAR